jgi:hemoglobin-like flavoprotein
MTPEQIALVQSSFERLGPDGPAMAARFYVELFQRDPALRPLFTTNMAEQQVKFAEKLSEIVQAMPRLDELLNHTRALGARHVAYGVHASDYQTVGDALIAALAAVLGEQFDGPTREAWMLAYNIVAETMLEGAASARPIGSLSRAVACKGFKPPPGKSCDEFPYASTSQGGAGAARTAVNKTENSSQGGNLVGFYNANRLFYGEKFHVKVS